MSSILAFSLVAGLGMASEKSKLVKGLVPGLNLIKVRLLVGSVNSKYILKGFLEVLLLI